MLDINFNNKNSFCDLGLVIENKPSIPISSRNYNTINVEGLNGTLTEDLKTYNDISITITFMIENASNSRLISSWFTNITDNKLIFSDNDDLFYKVKQVKLTEISRSCGKSGKFTLNFICDPFKYYWDGLDTMEIKKPTTICSPTTIYSPEFIHESEPTIKIYGQGDITLNINNNSIKLKNVQDYIILNGEIQECYKDIINCNNKMWGEFPTLVEENKISWTGNVQKIDIIPNWRCL